MRLLRAYVTFKQKMEPLGYMPYFEKPEFLAEIDLRGRFMMMSCDLEDCLLGIIMFSAIDPNNHHRSKEFKGMMMNAKIEAAICDIKKYHPNYYVEYKDTFDQLMEFKGYRNDMGHYPIRFTDETLKSFTIRYIDNINGVDKFTTKTYTVQEIRDVVDRFRKAAVTLSQLVGKLHRDYAQTYNTTHPDK